MSEQEYKVAGNLFTIWEFEGYLKYSPMFYGWVMAANLIQAFDKQFIIVLNF